MATFYTGVDKERYDAGNKFLPMNQFLLNYTVPKTNVEEDQVTTSYGIPNTNAFVNSGDGPGQVPLGLTYDPRAVAEAPASGQSTSFINDPASVDAFNQKIYDKMSSDADLFQTGTSKFPGERGYGKAPEYMDKDLWTGLNKYSQEEFMELNPQYFSQGNIPEEDEEKESWFSSLFSSTPKVRGTLGTRLANAPRIPLPAAMASWSLSPFNPESRNWNPNFEHQLNMLEMQNNMIGIDPNSGLYKYGPDSVLAGKNVISLFGSNDYEEALGKKKDWFQNRINRGKKISWTNYQKLLKEEEKLQDIQKNIDDKDKSVAKTIRPRHHKDVSGGGVNGKGGQGDYTTPSLHQAPEKHTAPSKTGHMGPGGKHYAQGGRVYLNLGGLASMLGRENFKKGGRIGFFKGALADTKEGKAMSPGTTAGGDFRGGDEGQGDSGNTVVIPKTNYVNIKPDIFREDPYVNISVMSPLEIAKLQASIGYQNIFDNDDLSVEGDLTTNIGPIDTRTQFTDDGIGNTDINWGNFSTTIDPNKNIQNIGYNNSWKGINYGINTDLNNTNAYLSLKYKNGGLASIL